MLRPYGELKAPQTDGEILETVKPINCEYLGRPEIGLSETGESYSENHERAMDLLREWDLDTISSRLQEYDDTIKMLNTRTELPFSKQDIIKAVKYHATDDNKLLTLLDDLEIIGNTFFTMAMHFKTLRALICNPLIYAQQIAMANGMDTELKKDLCVKNIRDLFIKEVVTVQKPKLPSRSNRNQTKILDELTKSSSLSASEHSNDS